MPVSIKASIQISITFHLTSPPGDHYLSTLLLNLLTYFQAVIVYVRNDRPGAIQFGNETWNLRAIIDLSPGNAELNGQAIGIDSQMDLAGIARPAFTYGLITGAGRVNPRLIPLLRRL